MSNYARVSVVWKIGNVITRYENFGTFTSVENAKSAVALAKATSGLPGYVDYSGAEFKIYEIKAR